MENLGAVIRLLQSVEKLDDRCHVTTVLKPNHIMTILDHL